MCYHENQINKLSENEFFRILSGYKYWKGEPAENPNKPKETFEYAPLNMYSVV